MRNAKICRMRSRVLGGLRRIATPPAADVRVPRFFPDCQVAIQKNLGFSRFEILD
jgi:hypothetical protein